VIHRPDRGFRNRFGGEIEAFNEAYSRIKNSGWEFLVKLDGDVSFDPDYFERCLQEFSTIHSWALGEAQSAC
jgi:biofilm PGA synthesis N-glycosyltransferase PgaC